MYTSGKTGSQADRLNLPCGWSCWTLLSETPLDCLVEPGFAEKSMHGEVVLETLLSDITTRELPR